MKVEFSSASMHSISPNRRANVSKNQNVGLTVRNSERLGPVVRISFKGNPNKNYSQVLSIAPEDKGMGIPEYNRGGLAVVVKEAPESFNSTLKADARNFLPYYSYDNPEGGIKVLRIPYDANGKQIMDVDPSLIQTKGLDYQLQPGEKFVIQSAPKKGLSRYIELEKLDVSGSVPRINPSSLDSEPVAYQVFKAILPNDGGVTRYILHTRDVAKFSKAYCGGGAYGAYGGGAYGGGAYSGGVYGARMNSDAVYADVSRAMVDALPKLNKKEFNDFVPATIWGHDRFMFPAMVDVADRSAAGDSYFNGVRMHGTFHNSGRVYQGVYENPFDFLRIVAGQDTITGLKKHPRYEFLKDIDAKSIQGIATKAEMDEVAKILEPVIGMFRDDFKTYNMTEIPLAAKKINPFNFSSGTVSINFGEEMKNHNTSEISAGMTRSYAQANLINITNGSSPASLQLDNPKANFGKGSNGLTEKKAGFTTYGIERNEKGEISNLNEILLAKKNNKKWLLDMIANADPSDPKSLEKLFFYQEQYAPVQGRPSTVVGRLSAYQEGDKLLLGWGRPDAQKGFPTTFESFYKFLLDKTVPEEQKKHIKLLVGAGEDTWEDNARDWINIKKIIKNIQELDNGKYRGNVMYVNGLFPNRLAGCADYTIFTSVFEPCGITPLESYSSGSPVISIRTGGAPDFIQDGVAGFLSKNPYLRNPSQIGISSSDLAGKTQDEIFALVDDRRRDVASDEIAQCIKRAFSVDDETYGKMVINAFEQKIGWDENGAYNKGIPAQVRYFRECFHVDEKTMTPIVGLERNDEPLKPIIGRFAVAAEIVKDKIKEIVQEPVAVAKATKWGKVITLGAVGLIAMGTGAMVYLNTKKAKEIKTTLQNRPFSRVG